MMTRRRAFVHGVDGYPVSANLRTQGIRCIGKRYLRGGAHAGRQAIRAPGNGWYPVCASPQLASFVEAPRVPHLLHRAQQPSFWLDVFGPQRITSGATAIAPTWPQPM